VTGWKATERKNESYFLRRNDMKLSRPKQITFWIAVILAVLGVIASLVTVPVLSGFAFWLVVIGFVVLAAGNLLEGV